MSVDKGFIKYPVYRSDKDVRTLEMYNKVAGVESKTDVSATFSDVLIQVRTGDNPNSSLIKSLSLAEGTITVTDTNVLNFDLSMNVDDGVYYYDVRFKVVGETQYQTYIKGVVTVENNVSR